MHIAILGTDYTLSDLPTREAWILSLRRIAQTFDFPHVLLVTCNRCEIYFDSEDLELTAKLLQAQLHPSKNQSYLYFGKECFAHLAIVSSGLGSAQIGETDIRRQVKQAYEKGKMFCQLTSDIHFLFQKSLKIGKQFHGPVHGIERQPSLERIVVERCLYREGLKNRELGKEGPQIFRPERETVFENTVRSEDGKCEVNPTQTKTDFSVTSGIPKLAQGKVFFLGNSQMNRKIIQLLVSKSNAEIWLCSQHVFSLFEDKKVKMIDFSQMGLWKECDVVICATDQEKYVITPPADKVNTRLVIDLSVPRCVDPQLQSTHHLPVLNMEHLNHQLEMSQLIYQDQIRAAKKEVFFLVDRLFALYKEKLSTGRNRLWMLSCSLGCNLPLPACSTTSTLP